MGTTFSSVHIYSSDEVHGFSNFHSFSEGWQTYIPDEEPEDPFVLQKLAKKISKSTDDPVLWFFIFDSETFVFEFYKNGKKVAACSRTDTNENKNMYGIPSLIGYESGQKRRLSRILSCSDIDYQLELLEEYFGVCLIPMPEMLEESPEDLLRVRSDELYQAYLAEEKKLTGKRAPFKVTLISEQTGKLFTHKFRDPDMTNRRPHHYYFGYDTYETNFEEGALRTVRFEPGRLVPITQEEFDAVPKVPPRSVREDGCFTEEYYPSYKVHFTDKAPEGFKNKTLVTPRGYYFFRFDGKGRVILSDEHGGIAIVDETLKVIAKMRVKGYPVDFEDGHILTVGGESFFAYYYNPSDKVRIYRIDENSF
ncbi:MAG: hypothetical protein E7218_06520 [Anaerofustis stercorihominis]|nr:hypothetical protein [Anaerofustis stercorihominis]